MILLSPGMFGDDIGDGAQADWFMTKKCDAHQKGPPEAGERWTLQEWLGLWPKVASKKRNKGLKRADWWAARRGRAAVAVPVMAPPLAPPPPAQAGAKAAAATAMGSARPKTPQTPPGARAKARLGFETCSVLQAAQVNLLSNIARRLMIAYVILQVFRLRSRGRWLGRSGL